MHTLQMDRPEVQECFEGWTKTENIQALQVAVFVMCGGGFLGRFAAEQPADFYIDTRTGKLPYKPKEILQAVRVLVEIAKKAGLNPKSLPEMPRFHNCGTF